MGLASGRGDGALRWQGKGRKCGGGSVKKGAGCARCAGGKRKRGREGGRCSSNGREKPFLLPFGGKGRGKETVTMVLSRPRLRR